ncbi:TetR/AcrR family transcriptional regulator [Herbiconiux sp. 11R-BC]|uniref:TetR/AcrR family transcriptional regulator n=1 Tax=Herbiconiux sp. 11R-BC TaxID=3111637 RepID=UPI003BFEFA8C
MLDAATAHFALRGFVGANVDEVAAEAGVAKRTVYNLYASKDELFRAVIERVTETAEGFMTRDAEAVIGHRPVREEIGDFAEAHARAVLAPRVLATRRLLVGESVRFPELAADYYERIPARVMRAIGRRLARYHDAGLLQVPDPDLAAEHFAFLVLGASLDRAMFDSTALAPVVVVQRARAGADAFVRAYR